VHHPVRRTLAGQVVAEAAVAGPAAADLALQGRVAEAVVVRDLHPVAEAADGGKSNK